MMFATKSRWLACFLLFIVLTVQAADKGVVILERRPEPGAPAPGAITYWTESRTELRPLRIHVLRVDLRAKGYETVALIANDPDGPGGAEAQLERPLPLAKRHGDRKSVV